MNTKLNVLIITILLFVASPLIFSAEEVSIKITGKPMSINPNMWGIFFEDINYAADGGLYPERIQNNSFEYNAFEQRQWNSLSFWTNLQTNPGDTFVSVENRTPLSENNINYVLLTIREKGNRNGLSNSGFDGIVVKQGDIYDVSFFARVVSGEPGPITVVLENPRGRTLATVKFDNLTDQWVKYTGTITAPIDQNDASIAILASGTGRIALDMVSFFPQNTFKNRPNGLRPDLAQVIADLKPAFVRFPGGCVAHGDGLDNMYRWKDTIGPLEQRKALRNRWGYHQSLGLGYFEYFQFCEDIGAEPLPVVPAGVCCQFSGDGGQQGIPMEEMDVYVWEVLDLIEWANGSEKTEWGKKRIEAGHPEPFNLKYIGLGNEDAITDTFKVRYKMINDAVKAKYPNITVIGTTGTGTDGADYDRGWAFAKEQKLPMVDEHGYKAPSWFWENTARFDQYQRTETKVYVGEFAAHENNRANTLRSALAEAAYMTSFERNGDLVKMSSYAPLLAKQGNTQWTPDMIYFDNTSITPSINYYVQQLFGTNNGDNYLPTQITINKTQQDRRSSAANGVLLGTWDTQSRFDDLQVTVGGRTVLQDSFDADSNQWQVLSGRWGIADGQYLQTSSDEPALTLHPFYTNNRDYTVTVKAMKDTGSEGFFLGFGAINSDNYYWFNVAGWNNTTHRIERTAEGSKTPIGPSVSGNIEPDRWYTLTVHVVGDRFMCYLDDQLVIDTTDSVGFQAPADITGSTVTDSKTGDVIIKLVSKSDTRLTTGIDMTDLGKFNAQAKLTVISGSKTAVNEFGKTPWVTPKISTIKVSEKFNYTAPPHSMSVIRFNPKK